MNEAHWYLVKPFTEFLAGLDDVPQDVDRLTPAHWSAWRLSLPPRANGYSKYASIAALLQMDPRLTQPVREAMATRFVWEPGREQAYGPEEFKAIRTAARRTFRSALLRIRENTDRLAAWRAGAMEPGSREWLVGEALDVLARTGDVPLYEWGRRVRRRYRPALGGDSAQDTWKRLFLSRKETAALAVLIAAELGLNSTPISEMPVPEMLPGTAEAGMPVYRLRLEKRHRAGHRGRFESRNLTDSGADSSGRIISEALEATAHARAVLALLGADIDRLLVWHQTTEHEGQAYRRAVRVGQFGFGVDERAGADWARSVGLSGSPLKRIRKTVNVLHRREPGQNTQDTHDSVYVLPEPQVQQAAVPVIADGALDAVAAAHRTVFAAIPRGRISTGRVVGFEGMRNRVEDFIAWVSGLAVRLDRPHEVIPDDPFGALGVARFRRSLAWHIARRPGGLVALAVQYGHLRTAVSAGYAARGRGGIHELLDIETARATADTLTTLHDDLAAGTGISGPAARRAIHAAAQAPTFVGSIRTHRQARDILGNPALTVYDNPHSLLMCVYNRDRALCHRLDVTDAPGLDRCQPSCANIARTDRHADELLQRAQTLKKQAASEAVPGPLADRLTRRADHLRSLADRHNHNRINSQEPTV